MNDLTMKEDARALRTLGRQLAEVKDQLEAADRSPQAEAAYALDEALDAIDSAIRTLEDDEEA